MAADQHEIGDVEGAADVLYGLDPQEFVATRDALAKQARIAGDRELAKKIKGLRRPTVLAAEINRVIRADPEGVERLIDAATALGAAFDDSTGDSGDARSAQAAHREAAHALAQGAVRDVTAVHAALVAASLDPGQHDGLRAGRYATEPSGPVGFELLTPTAHPPPADTRLAKAQAAAEQAQARAKTAAAALEAAEREHADAQQRVEEQQAALAVARERRDSARREHREAVRRERDAAEQLAKLH